MQDNLIIDFADLPQNTIERQVNATEQLGVLCGLNRRTCRRLGKMVFLILSNHPPESLLENSIWFALGDHGWSLRFEFVTHPATMTSLTDAGARRNLTALHRAGERLETFEINGSPADGFEIRFKQNLAIDFEVPRIRELKQWVRIVSRGNWEEAFERLSSIYSSGRTKLQQLRDGISIRRELLDGEKGPADVILSLVASKTDNSVMIMDAEGKIEWVNRAFRKLTGYEPAPEDKSDAASVLFQTGQHENGDGQLFTKALQEGRNFNFEYGWTPSRKSTSNPAGQEESFWIEFQVTPVRDEHDSIVRWIAIGADITRRREAELAMQVARDVAESASKAKTEFLAMMSHEIRTPMNAILGMTELVLGTSLTPEQSEYLATVQNSAESLLHVLNDILDLSKVEADRLEIERTDFDLFVLIQETVKSLGVLAAQKELQLLWNHADDIPYQLVGDPGRIRQILVNLIGNAIKFTDQGSVSLDVELTDQRQDRVTIHFAVRDTGCGIAEDKTSRIFEAFYQTDASSTRQTGGTGLGLAITSELVRLMGGRIWVESKLGRGSAFHFVLTLSKSGRLTSPSPRDVKSPPDRIPTKNSMAVASTPLSILVVDDHESNRKLIMEVLKRRGHRCQQAATSREALDWISRDQFDAVLMDVQMPEQDGLQTTSEIRNLPGNASKVPIIAVTAFVTQEDRQRCLDAGMNDYLAKPVRTDELIDKVEFWSVTDDASRRSVSHTDTASPDGSSAVAASIVSNATTPTTPESRENADGFANALFRLGGDVELLKMQMGYFLSETPQLLDNIGDAINHRNARTLLLNAHRLKGLVRSYDDDLSAELAMKLEDIGRSDKFLEAESTFSLLKPCVARLGERLQRFCDSSD